MHRKLAVIGLGALAAGLLFPRGAAANPADKVYFKYQGKTTLILDKDGYLHTRGDEIINAGTVATNQTDALVIKRGGVAAFSSRAATVVAPGQRPIFAWQEPTTSGEFLSANSFVAELVSSLPLPGETGVWLFKYQGVAKMELDHLLSPGPQALILKFYDRTFSQHPRRDVTTLLALPPGQAQTDAWVPERQPFIDAIIHLQQIKYPGGTSTNPTCAPGTRPECSYCDGTPATSQNLDPHGVMITYRLPGTVTHFAKYDEIHANARIHSGSDQWPWHREMLNRFEAELQEFDPLVNLHYWSWSTTPAADLMAPMMPSPNFGNASGDIGGAWATAGFSNTSCNTACLGSDPCSTNCSNPCRETPPTHAECPHGPSECGGNPCVAGHCASGCGTDIDCGQPVRTPHACVNGFCTNDMQTIWSRWNAAFAVRTVERNASIGVPMNAARMIGEAAWCHPGDWGGFMNALILPHSIAHDSVGPTIVNLTTAARDPMFFLLHGDIDRWMTSWQYANGYYSWNPTPQMFEPVLDADATFITLPEHSLWGYINPDPMNRRPIEYEGLFTPLEPWADFAPSPAVYAMGSPAFVPRFTTHGYRHVRPWTDNCGTDPSMPINAAVCAARNPVDGPTPHAQSVTSQDTSLLIPAPYDNAVPYPTCGCAYAYDGSQCQSYGVGTIVYTSDDHYWTCVDPHCDACFEFDCGPGSTNCPWGQVWVDNGPCPTF